MTLHTYEVTIHFDGTRIMHPVQAEDMAEALWHAAGLLRQYKATKQARRLHIERRDA